MQLLESALEQDQQGCNLRRAETVAEHALLSAAPTPKFSRAPATVDGRAAAIKPSDAAW